MKTPDILWICTDSQRWDTLGCTGNRFVRTLAALTGELALRLGDRMAATCDPLPARTADW
jgi:arylsulfatase A-like enzyme